jgi:hypothetical protein
MIESQPQTPLPTQVEDVDTIWQIVHEEGKTIRFNIPLEQTKPNKKPWQRKKAKKQHNELKQGAREHL